LIIHGGSALDMLAGLILRAEILIPTEDLSPNDRLALASQQDGYLRE